MYRQILIPNEQNHSIDLPENLYGKKIEIIAFEIDENADIKRSSGKKTFLDDIEPIADFPAIENIRERGWPERW